jgi:hypothetical protein
MEVGYKKPPISTETQFKPNNAGKPVGARMKQVTQFRRYLEKKRTVETATGEEVDGKTFLLKTQLDKAIDEKDTAAAKFCMDYAGYKPVEKLEVESKDTEEFSSEQEEREFLRLELIEIERMAIEKSDSILQNAELIISKTANAERE